MIIPTISSTNSVAGLVTFQVKTDENPSGVPSNILSITISREVNRIPTAKIIIRDGSVALQDFEISNTDEFKPGQEIEIKAGRNGDDESIFKGIIVKQCVKVTESSNSVLIIECKGECVKMTIGRKNKYFSEVTDSQAITEVLGEYQLTGEINDTIVTHKEIVQHYSTDWDFILSRAEVNGRLLIADDGKINLVKPDSNQDPVLTLKYGENLLDFQAEMDATTQWKNVKAKSWDHANQALFEAETSESDFVPPGDISGSDLGEVIDLENFELSHSGYVNQEELQIWADACMLKSRLSKIRGRAKVFGLSELKPGIIVDIKGIGKRFNGKAYVTGVRHELRDGSWYGNVQFGLSPDWCSKKEDIIEPLAGGLVPGIHGLQIGKVVQLQDDPEGAHRILVKLPIIDNEAQGIWARAASLDAGNNRGAFFRPEIDDEVIVGFVNGDPRDAIVLGMLHSSDKPAPIIAEDVNHEKGFVTRSEMKLLFNDDKKIITIETPAGNSIVISEEDTSIILTDQNSNTITMNTDGIALESPKDINIKANQNIKIQATQNIDIEAMNITIKANIQLDAEGGGAGKLSLNAGQAVLKGSMVMIN